MSCVNRAWKNLFSGKQAARKPIRRQSVRLGLEALEERWCPTSTTWDPTISSGGVYYWAIVGNWTNGVPNSTKTAIFQHGAAYNIACTCNSKTTVSLEFTGGYTNTITVSSGDTLTLSSVTESSSDSPTISLQTSSGTMGGGTGATLAFSGTASFNNIIINDTATGSNAKGVIQVNNGGTLNLGTTNNNGTQYRVEIQDQLTIQNGGVCNIGDSTDNDAWSSVSFTPNSSSQGISVKSGGALYFCGPHDADNHTIFSDGSGTIPVIITVGNGAAEGALYFLGQYNKSSVIETVQAVVYNNGLTYVNESPSGTFYPVQWELTGTDSNSNTFVNGGTTSGSYRGVVTYLGHGSLYMSGNYVQNSWTDNDTTTQYGDDGSFVLTSSTGSISFNGGRLVSAEYLGNNTNDNTLEFSSGNVVFGNGAVGQDTFYLDVAIDETTVNYTPIQLSSGSSQTLAIDSFSVLNVDAFGTTSQNKTWYIVYCTGKAGISGSFGNPGGPADWLSGPTFSQTASAITMTGTP